MENRILAFHYAWYGTPWGPSAAKMAGTHSTPSLYPSRENDGKRFKKNREGR